jgi:Icc-related predicted phosphoesterase
MILNDKQIIRLAAIADIHYSRTSQGALQPLFARINEEADVLALCGDLTDYGLPEEAHSLAEELTTIVKIPMVAVLGNHDFESGKQEDVKSILGDAGVTMLDGDACEIQGLGFAGVKGFAGGFWPRSLAAWGETAIKSFVHEAVDEALKLESALGRLRTKHRFAILHYSPIRATVEGEPPEIFAFLGSSRLEEPLDRFAVNAVFHGHAHHGSPEGHTKAGIPVYNVSLSLMQRRFPGRPAYRIIEVVSA